MNRGHGAGIVNRGQRLGCLLMTLSAALVLAAVSLVARAL